MFLNPYSRQEARGLRGKRSYFGAKRNKVKMILKSARPELQTSGFMQSL